ncbi:hypothetical protein HEK616_62490 [Streptomyces nigrescens]|uniref:Uncharacterized protein n=1 Tax=Streptomyces nigrescens TaxID=1920 RepID=A0ABN6R4Z3_STRNI|nr:hypothetical protein HEK616_62490 [Streptomyces nigrescens]
MAGRQFVRLELRRHVQALDGDLTPEEFVPGPPDGAHPALAYPFNQAIPPGDQSPLVHRRRLRHRTPLRKPVRIRGATIVSDAGAQPPAHRWQVRVRRSGRRRVAYARRRGISARP